MEQPFAAKDSRTSATIARDLNRGRVLGTKLNYVSLLRNYFNYCLEHDEDPFKPYIDPVVAIHWMYHQTMRLGSCNSRSTWSATLSWWVWLHGRKATFFKNGLYRRVWEVMVTLYTIPRKPRLPMRLEWVVNYLKFLGVTPDTWHKVSLQSLTIALFYILLFLTISRPAELLFTNSTEDETIEIITTGLRWKDLTFHNMDQSRYAQYISLEIHWFKNQQHRNQSKIIDMQSPLCRNKDCKCKYLDFIAILRTLKQRRDALIIELGYIKRQNGFLNKKQQKQFDNLKTEMNDYILVGGDGKRWTPPHMRPIMKHFQQVIGMEFPERFPLYCVRIGAMSRVNQQKMDLLKVLRYVAWSVSNLPHVSNRYVNFKSEDLRTIPFEIIHGALDKNGVRKDYSHTPLSTFDLASTKDIMFN